MQHQTRLFLLKHKKDCCCVHNERIERNKYIATHVSIQHPDCPEKKNYSRIKVLIDYFQGTNIRTEEVCKWQMVFTTTTTCANGVRIA